MSSPVANSHLLECSPIIQYWHDRNVPPYIDELLASFHEHNPDRPHMVFNEASAAELIEGGLSTRETKAFRALRKPRVQADYFRLCAVYILGGMWCDADSLCEASLGRIIDDSSGELFKFAPDIDAVNNAFLVFDSPGHPLLKLAIDIANLNIEERTANFVAGPGVLSILVESKRLGSFDDLLAVEAAEDQLAYRHHLPNVLRRTLNTLSQQHLESLRAMITEARLTEALEGVLVSPIEKLTGVIRHHPWPLPYQENRQQINAGGSK